MCDRGPAGQRVRLIPSVPFRLWLVWRSPALARPLAQPSRVSSRGLTVAAMLGGSGAAAVGGSALVGVAWCWATLKLRP